MARRRGKGRRLEPARRPTDKPEPYSPSPLEPPTGSLALVPSQTVSGAAKTRGLTLPVELIRQIFQYLHDKLNPDPNRWWDTAYISSRTFVKLSLVCRDWRTIARKHRATVFIGSAKGAKKFISTFRRAELDINKLHYDVVIPNEILNKMLPLLNRKLTALSMPAGMLQSRHTYNVLKNPETRHAIQSLHVHGKLADDYHGCWWNRAYHLHDVPTLTELSLTGLYIKGIVKEVSAAVQSSITKVSFERLRFQSAVAIEHLCRPIIYDTEALHISSLSEGVVADVLTYFGTSWVGLKYIEMQTLPKPLVIDTHSETVSPGGSITDAETMERMRALFRLCRKLNFDTARSMNFLGCIQTLLNCSGDLLLPSVFRLRQKLEKKEVEQFQQDYALLTGLQVHPTLVDPPEFFENHSAAPEEQWGGGGSW